MPHPDARRSAPIAVGSRVTVIPSPGSPSRDISPQVGVVVEDYAESVIDSSDLGRDWAPVLRWAIALDDGRLIFAAEGDLNLSLSPRRITT